MSKALGNCRCNSGFFSLLNSWLAMTRKIDRTSCTAQRLRRHISSTWHKVLPRPNSPSVFFQRLQTASRVYVTPRCPGCKLLARTSIAEWARSLIHLAQALDRLNVKAASCGWVTDSFFDTFRIARLLRHLQTYFVTNPNRICGFCVER